MLRSIIFIALLSVPGLWSSLAETNNSVTLQALNEGIQKAQAPPMSVNPDTILRINSSRVLPVKFRLARNTSYPRMSIQNDILSNDAVDLINAAYWQSRGRMAPDRGENGDQRSHIQIHDLIRHSVNLQAQNDQLRVMLGSALLPLAQ